MYIRELYLGIFGTIGVELLALVIGAAVVAAKKGRKK